MAAKKIIEPDKCTLGVQTIEELGGGKVLVTGRIAGLVRPGMDVMITNPGVDVTLARTVIEEVVMASGSVNKASDCVGGVQFKVPEGMKIRVGTVIYTDDSSDREINDAYIKAVGDVFVAQKQIELTDEELESMSIADLTESWRLFGWFQSQMGDKLKEDEIKAGGSRIERLAAVLCKKILAADCVYVVYNKTTDEPHMFSSVARQADGQYMCTSPDILLIPKSYYKAVAPMYNKDNFELRKIENGEDGKGISNFLGYAFYINGASGVAVISGKTSIDAPMLVPKPDYSNVPEAQRPVTNPGLMRWMLLFAQLGNPDTEDKKIISNLFYTFMSQEIENARLLIPMKKNDNMPKPDADGNVVIEEGVSVALAVSQGKYDRQVVRMYTDWKRLRMEFGEDWDALIQPVSGMIETMDCVINATKIPALAFYISKDTYDMMTKQK